MKKRNPKVTTPKGIAVWPWLNEPDRKFNAEGDYKVNLQLAQEDAQDFMEQLKSILQDHYKATCEAQGKTKLKKAPLPVIEVEDDEGNETGDVQIKFKLKAQYTYDGKTISQRPVLMDAKRQPMTEKIGGGSTIRVGCEVYPYYTATIGVGLSLRCKVVQVLELKEFSAGAGGFDFNEEDGFEAVSDSMANAATDTTTDTTTDDLVSDADFI
jgi:hypothetical protein